MKAKKNKESAMDELKKQVLDKISWEYEKFFLETRRLSREEIFGMSKIIELRKLLKKRLFESVEKDSNIDLKLIFVTTNVTAEFVRYISDHDENSIEENYEIYLRNFYEAKKK